MIAPSIFYAMILLVRFPFFTIWSVFMNNQSVMIPLKKYQVLPKSIVLNKYKHKTFEERVAEYNGEITVDISHILVKCTLCQGHYDFSFSDFYFIFVCCVEASK